MENTQKATTLVDHFFRNEFGKLVAHLTAKFGPTYLEEAEDAVQEALIKAMQSWSLGKIPDNPSGWVFRVANNKLIDQLRKKQKVYYTTQYPEDAYVQTELNDDLFKDDIIKMIFACCNPKLSLEYQVILTLKILGGLSIREIASALLKKEDTIAKSYTRAKKKFREENLKLEIPPQREIQSRLLTVLKIIYLIFNEGYKSTESTEVIRYDLCEEAMRLNHLLLGKEETNNDWSRSLMALMHYHSARFDARTNDSGEIISLDDQDRNLWDNKHIEMGNKYLGSVKKGLGNTYFIQAAISGIHCNAKTYDQTDWKSILALYDNLLTIEENPVIALNRIIPVSKVHGPEIALEELEALDIEALKENYLFPAIKGELLTELNNIPEAKVEFRKASTLCKNQKERDYFDGIIKELGG